MAVCTSAVAQAGRLSITGRVLLGRTASEPVPGTWVVLHTITPEGGNPTDSVRSTRDGGFRFTAQSDSGSVYIVSTMYAGIAYFSAPVHGFSDPETDLIPILVFDTTSGAPAISLTQRHLVVGAVKADGSHDILDVLELTNSGTTTRVSGSDADATWVGMIPADAGGMAVGDGDIGMDAVQLVGDSVRVFAPMPPGSKQLTLSYTLAGDQRILRFTADQPVERLNVVLEDPSAEVIQGPLVVADTRVVEGRAYQFFVADTVATGTAFELRLAGVSTYPRSAVLFIVLGMTGALVIGVTVAIRKRQTPRVEETVASPDLAAQIAALDRKFGGGQEGSVEQAGWEQYQQERGALKEQLKAALARQQGRQ